MALVTWRCAASSVVARFSRLIPHGGAPRLGFIGLVAGLVFFSTSVAFAEGNKRPVKLYIDANRANAQETTVAIEQGIRAALEEVDNQLDGRPVKLEVRDHAGSSTLSRLHLEEFLTDRRALAVFSGLHSPPLSAHKEFINARQILVLDPWAKTGPTAPSTAQHNWVFRLSADDTRAGRVIARTAIGQEGFQRPFPLAGRLWLGKIKLALDERSPRGNGGRACGRRMVFMARVQYGGAC